jgi:hypothetical protein
MKNKEIKQMFLDRGERRKEKGERRKVKGER